MQGFIRVIPCKLWENEPHIVESGNVTFINVTDISVVTFKDMQVVNKSELDHFMSKKGVSSISLFVRDNQDVYRKLIYHDKFCFLQMKNGTEYTIQIDENSFIKKTKEAMI